MEKRLRIAVVGGGIAGCAAATLLAREGHDVELLEQTPHLGPVGAGILIQPSGQRVLNEMGLLDTVAARSARIEALVAWTRHGRTLSRLTYADYFHGAHALGVHRADLFAVMHDACVSDGVRVRLGVTATATRCERDGRRLRGNGGEIGSYDLVIAADGARSRLRAASGLRSFAYAYHSAALWAVGCSAWPTEELVQYTRGNAILCGMLPMGGGRCSFFWGIDRDDYTGLRQTSFDAWRASVLRVAPAAREMLGRIGGWNELVFASYRAVVMPRVTAARLAFIGDAAHAAGPHLGQGANLALLDAIGLRDSLRSQRTLADGLGRFERSQRLRNAYYSLVTAALMPTFQSSLAVLGPARDVALPLLQKVTPIRRLMLRTLCGTRADHPLR